MLKEEESHYVREYKVPATAVLHDASCKHDSNCFQLMHFDGQDAYTKKHEWCVYSTS